MEDCGKIFSEGGRGGSFSDLKWHHCVRVVVALEITEDYAVACLRLVDTLALQHKAVLMLYIDLVSLVDSTMISCTTRNFPLSHLWPNN